METTTTDTWGQLVTVGSGASTLRTFETAAPAALASAGAPVWHRSHLAVHAMSTAYGVKPVFNGITRRPSEGSS